jgi:hypothetical protein
MLLSNAFSLNMVAALPATISVRELALDEVKQMLDSGFTSAVGHADTAAVFSDQLGVTVPTKSYHGRPEKG